MDGYSGSPELSKEGFSHPSQPSSAAQPRGRLLVMPPPSGPNPVDAYLARLAPSSANTMRKLLRRIATLVSPELTESTAHWHRFRYPASLEIRRRLLEIYVPATCRLALCALRGVLRESWRLGQLSREDYERAIDLPAVRGNHKQLRPEIDPQRIQQLFLRSGQDSSPRALRDVAILAVLYGGGLRRAELAALSLEDYQDDALKVCGKGRQYRPVYMPREAAGFVTRWVAARGHNPGPLFSRIHRSGTITSHPLSPEAIARIVRRRAAEAGIGGNLAPHDLRRAFATKLLGNGVDLLLVQRMMRHRSVSTTSVYDHRTEMAQRAAAEQLFRPT